MFTYMVAILLFAVILMAVLAVLIARYAAPRSPMVNDDVRPLMPMTTLRQLTAELLAAMGLELEKPVGDERSLIAYRDEPLGRTRYVVTLAPDADQAAILSAADSVRGEEASRGLLISPGVIENGGLAGLDVPLDVIDGPHFRQLVARHLPARLDVIDHYRGFSWPATPLITRPV
jgi:hypothetical protein